ncbi:NAD(P)-dependent oxidoreductase [Thetidibacter halocola]|uniref:NAD(P)-dependent oxidoreductase n=1 Tax=Thetidibacter halocola TaxID=2827239 RepID=A0A8J7WIZ5_9RHOB|nr:NAD(P)-dependent oxidoreductase [Thetidibacter halocola]MBS0126501.1 NAD(P)-dependent oxidoreductase [Thetidibacter halocola]
MTQDPRLPPVGFIGLGIMGQHMAGHLLDAGYPLHVYNRTASRTAALVERGATAHDTPAGFACCEVVITMVGYPSDVEQVYLGAEGLLAHAKAGTTLIDMTTSSPELAARIAALGAENGIGCLDAPVSGGDVGARDAKLAIMVGGDVADFNRAMPLFQKMGAKIAHMGPAGAGQHTKMANQIAIASTVMGTCESLAYARAAGLDAAQVLEAIGTGAAGSFQLNVLGPKMLKGDFAPGFFVHHFVKDMSIALAEAERLKLDLPGLALARKLFDRLVEQGHDQDGTQGLFRLYGAST